MWINRVARCLCLAVSAAAAVAAFAEDAQISQLSTGEAALGTVFHVTGTGFGKNPKVYLTQDGVPVADAVVKVRSLRPANVSDQILTVQVVKGVAGAYGIRIQPRERNSTPADSADVLRLVPPTVESVSPSSVGAKEDVTLVVRSAGSTKGAVYVAGRRARVLAQSPDPADANLSLVRLRLAGTTPDGRWEVQFRNALGESIAHQALTVSGARSTALGKPVIEATVDGARFAAKKFLLTAAARAGRVLVEGRQIEQGVTTRLQIVAPFDADKGVVPTVLRTGGALIACTQTAADGTFTVWETAPGVGVSIFVNAVTSAAVAGSFVGDLTRVAGLGDPAVLRVQGRFTASRTVPFRCRTEAVGGHFGGDIFLTSGIDVQTGGRLDVEASGVGLFRSLRDLRAQLRTPDHVAFALGYDVLSGSTAVITSAGAIERFSYRPDGAETYEATTGLDGRSSVTVEVLKYVTPLGPFGARSTYRPCMVTGRLQAADGRSVLVAAVVCVSVW